MAVLDNFSQQADLNHSEYHVVDTPKGGCSNQSFVKVRKPSAKPAFLMKMSTLPHGRGGVRRHAEPVPEEVSGRLLGE